MKRVLGLLLALNFLLFFSGCNLLEGQRELNEIGIILGMAIDKENDQWAVTYQGVIPRAVAAQAVGGGNNNLPPVTVFTTFGATLYDAVANIAMEKPRVPILSHNQVVIVSEKVAREEGVSQIVDFCVRSQEIRPTTLLLLTKGRASELLEILLPSENISSNAIRNILEKGALRLSNIRSIELHDFIDSVASPSQSAALPEMMEYGNKKPQTSLNGLKASRSSASLKAGELGVFNKDKLVGWLDDEASTGLAFITNKAKGLPVSFNSGGKDGHDVQSSYQMLKASSKLKIKMEDGKIKAKLDIKTYGILTETTSKLDLTKPDSIKKMEDSIKRQITKQVEYAWKKVKDLQVDAAGIGNKVNKKYPKEWKKMKPSWNILFTKIELETTVSVDMEHTGLTSDSFSRLLKN